VTGARTGFGPEGKLRLRHTIGDSAPGPRLQINTPQLAAQWCVQHQRLSETQSEPVREDSGRDSGTQMMQGQVAALDAHMALTAAQLSRAEGLPMADSIILATGLAAPSI
jgi:hypothetical protein